MQYDLELVFVKNSHAFVEEYLKRPDYVELMRRLGALGDGKDDQSKFNLSINIQIIILNWDPPFCFELYNGGCSLVDGLKIVISGTLSADEWEVAYLYCSFVLRKVELKLFFRVKNMVLKVRLYS